MTLKTVVKLSPLALPVVAYAESGNLTAKENVIPYSPVVLPVWAWFVVGAVGTWALFRYWK